VTAHAIVAAVLLAAPARVVTLEQAIESAHAHQPQLRQARAVTEAAEARAREAKSSLLPQLSASAGYLRTTANFTARPGTVPGSPGAQRGSTFDSFNYFSDSVTLSQLLYDFGQATGRYDAAQAQAQAQADSERAVGLVTELTVRSAFFDARANKSLVEVARQALANQEAHLGQIEGFVQVGTRPDIDLAQARSDTANARVQLISAENTYDISRATLNQAMGVEGPLDYDVADQALLPVAGEGLPIDPLLDEAIKARPEIASLMKQVRAMQLTMRSIEGAYGPTLGASLGFTQGGLSVDHLTWNLSAGLTLTWQLYQGGLTKAQVREAQANVAQVAAQLDLVRQQLRIEVEQARLSVRAAQASLGAAKDALVNARERLRLAEGRYETGIGSIIELGDAQVALTTAATQAVQADLKLSTARAQLLKALGRS
jgi:outer membrane protein